jgi:hypothetical protein
MFVHDCASISFHLLTAWHDARMPSCQKFSVTPALQRGDELTRVGQAVPHLREERGTLSAPFEHDAVGAGRSRCSRSSSSANDNPPGSTTTTLRSVCTKARQRRVVAGIEKRGGVCILLDIPLQ